MHWQTRISVSQDGERFIYGHNVDSLVRSQSFSDVVFLLLTGHLPSDKERSLWDALLISIVEHGVEPPSTFVPRAVISTGSSLPSALAAGILSINKWHGGAIEDAAFHLQSKESASDIVKNALARGNRIPGYGHKVYKDRDPRARTLLEKARGAGVKSDYIKKALSIEAELKTQTGKHLPMNIDGAIAAVMCELGIDARLGQAVFALGRMPGMIAHAYEEMVYEKPYRRFEESDVEYIGDDITKKKNKKS